MIENQQALQMVTRVKVFCIWTPDCTSSDLRFRVLILCMSLQGGHLFPGKIAPRKESDITVMNKDTFWDSMELEAVSLAKA